MPAKQTLTLLQLLSYLASGAQSPAQLAVLAQTSLATVNRRLKEALLAGLVAKEGRGPGTQYRAATPQEQLDALGAKPPGAAAANQGGRVFVEMDQATAGLVQNALETYARIGLGQFEAIVSLARLGALTRSDGSPIPIESQEAASVALASAKASLMGLGANVSKGIYGPHVGAEFRKAWEAHTALRHRLAWDRNPQGGIGVQFDEPLTLDGPDRPDITVSSGMRAMTAMDVLDQLPRGAFIGKRGKYYQVIGPNSENTAMQVLGESVSPQTAILMAQNVIKGAGSRDFSF